MKQVTIPAQWLQELIALCGPEDHELRERVMKSAAPAPIDALATGGQAQATEAMERAVAFALIGIAPETPLAEATVKPYLKQAKQLLKVAFNAAPQAQAVEVDDQMALAFHHAITDGAIGQDDLNEIKIGLRAVLANLHAPQAQADARDAAWLTTAGRAHGFRVMQDISGAVITHSTDSLRAAIAAAKGE